MSTSVNPLVVIVSGLPCAGKTHLARRLAADLSLPLICKDDLKELLFDTLGWRDRAWSKQLGGASYELLYYFIESQLAAQRSFIIEGNLSPDMHTARFAALQQRYNFTPAQIQCVADGNVLWTRFRTRAESGERHPGHVDHSTYDELRLVLLQGRLGFLDISGFQLELDTTDFAAVDYPAVVEIIRSQFVANF